MSDDRAFVRAVALGIIEDPCTYRCTGTDGTTHPCERNTRDGQGPLMVYEGVFWPGVLPLPGTYQCNEHRPRRCFCCGDWTPWFDGLLCDVCERLDDDDRPDDDGEDGDA